MNYIINIKPINNKFNINLNNNIKFTFINDLLDYIDISNYYDYLNSLNDREINNMYNIIYIKWVKLINNKKIDVKNKLDHPNRIKITKKNLNELLQNFCQENTDINKICKCIFIMNIISVNLI
tara:strand:- start:1262 stop:1630 length:369 start_codon:yes stop_codon:yes gene_type:complete